MVQADRGTSRNRCISQSSADLTETSSRVEKVGEPDRLHPRNAGEHFAQQLAESPRRDASFGLHSRQLLRLSSPDLARVRVIELVADRLSSPASRRRQGPLSMSNRVPAANRGFSLSIRSSGLSGKWIQRPSSLMRPCRGRCRRSSPNSSRRSSSIAGAEDGWSRWLPKSTGCPWISKLAAFPPTKPLRSRTTTSAFPSPCRRKAAPSPAGPAPRMTIFGRLTPQSPAALDLRPATSSTTEPPQPDHQRSAPSARRATSLPPRLHRLRRAPEERRASHRARLGRQG